MEIFIQICQLILSLAILVTLHEFGHYIPAVLFKTRVEAFYLFFNWKFALFRAKKVHGKWNFSFMSTKSPEEWSADPTTTEWGIGWIPLGGFVKIAGMIDESMDTEQMKQPAQAWEFRSKKAWQRLIIMVGGVTVNLILGFMIYIGVILFFGQKVLDPSALKNGMAVHPMLKEYNMESGDKIISMEGKKVIDLEEVNKAILLRDARNLVIEKPDGKRVNVKLPADIDSKLFQGGAMRAVDMRHTADTIKHVQPKSPALKAGLLEKDVILSINDKPIRFFDELQSTLYAVKGKSAIVVVQRGNKTDTIKSKVTKEGLLGLELSHHFTEDTLAIKTLHFGLSKSISVGFMYGKNTLSDYVSQFKFVFTKKGASSVGGFASISQMFPPLWDWRVFWMTTALLSIILAFMNILPIPALDGGHVVFLLYEMITGKEAPQKVLEYAQIIGISLLLGLMLYANGNDLVKYLFK